MTEKRKDTKNRNLRDGESQLPDGRYRYRFTDGNGKRKTIYSWRLVRSDATPAGKRADDCLRDKEAALKRDIADGIDSAAGTATVNDYFKRFMEIKRMKQSSTALYEYMYTHYAAEIIGNRKIRTVKFSDIKKLYMSLIEKGLQPKTIHNLHAVLHSVFEMAVQDDAIRKNPATGAYTDIAKGSAKTHRRALTAAEQKAFMNFLSGSDLYRQWLPLFTVAAGTGMRCAELTGLTWQDCDFRNGVIHVRRNMIYGKRADGTMGRYISTPKTTAGSRTVPMIEETKKALLAEKQRQMQEGIEQETIDGVTGFCFVNRYGAPHTSRQLDRVIERIRTAYNAQEEKSAAAENREPLYIEHFSMHTWRHTFATRCFEGGLDAQTLQSVMGHSSYSITADIYTDISESIKRDNVQSIEGKIHIS